MSALKPADATRLINRYARDPNGPDLIPCLHLEDRLDERDLLMADLLYVLKFGFVFDEGEAATRPGHFKYAIEAQTPNSENRYLRVIVIPGPPRGLKIVTIMWRDEK